MHILFLSVALCIFAVHHYAHVEYASAFAAVAITQLV